MVDTCASGLQWFERFMIDTSKNDQTL